MKDGGLWLSVDYRALNLATVKNQYPLPLISEMLDRVHEARIFTKLDLRGLSNLIQDKEGNEYTTSVRTRYGQFKYRLMQFGLQNTPAMFQSYIDDCLPTNIDDIALCYFDDILIYSTNEKEQEQHWRYVMQWQRELSLYCKAEKCQFGVSEVGFLGFVITHDGVGLQSDRISTIEDWPTLKSVRHVQVLHEFTNFYRRFILQYDKGTISQTELLKKSETFRGQKLEA
jgi:hypothetical protein